MDRRLEFVRRLFKDISDDALAGIAARVTRRELAIGETLAIGRCAWMSDAGDFESGRLENGSWRAIAPFGPDTVWNVYGLYYEDEHPSTAALRDELKTNPALAQCIIDELALALRAAQKSNGKLRDMLHDHLGRPGS